MLRAAGCSVRFIQFQHAQAGCPDLLVGRAGRTYLLEVKRPRTGRVSKGQREFFATWQGHPIVIVETEEQALRAVGLNPETERRAM